MAGCVDVRLFGDLTALLADLALLALLGAGGVLQDLEITILVLTAGELLDRAADQVGDLLIQVIHLARHGIVDLTADLITDPVAQLAGQELVHGIGHLVVRDIAGACTQLADLIRDQIGHAGQQVFLQAVHDLLGRPAAVHALLCIGGCIFRNLAHLVHEGRVIHQLVPDLRTDFLHRGGTQFGLEELCVGLILHELIHGQVHGVIHQRTGQGIPFFIIIFIPFTRLTGIYNVLYQLQHHITDDLRIVRCLFLVIRHTDVIDCIVHGVVQDLLDARLRGLAALYVACQLVHHIGDGVLRQEAVVQAALQVGHGIVQRLQGLVQILLADGHIGTKIAHTDLDTRQLRLHGAGDLIQRIKGFFLGLGILDGFLCICQSLVDDCINILICRLAVQLDVVQGRLGFRINTRILVGHCKLFACAMAVITVALVGKGHTKSFCRYRVVCILMRQGVAVGTKVRQILRIGRRTALTGAVCRLGLLLTGGLVVVHILAPDMVQSRVLFRIGHVNVLLVAAIPLAHLIPLAGGGAGGSFNDPLCALKIVVQGRVGFCIAFLYHLVGAAAALAGLVLFSGSGTGSLHHDPVAHIVVQGRFEIIFFCCRAAVPEDVILTLVNGISLLRASRGNCFFFLPFMLMFL